MVTSKHTCCWIIKPASPNCSAVYCDNLTSYSLATDDDGNKYRKYDTFCSLHKERAEQLDSEVDDEWENQ